MRESQNGPHEDWYVEGPKKNPLPFSLFALRTAAAHLLDRGCRLHFLSCTLLLQQAATGTKNVLNKKACLKWPGNGLEKGYFGTGGRGPTANSMEAPMKTSGLFQLVPCWFRGTDSLKSLVASLENQSQKHIISRISTSDHFTRSFPMKKSSVLGMAFLRAPLFLKGYTGKPKGKPTFWGSP